MASTNSYPFNDFRLADELPLSLPAGLWFSILEWIGTFSHDERPAAATTLGNQIYDLLIPEAHRKAVEAAMAARNDMPDMSAFIQQAAQQLFPGAEVQVQHVGTATVEDLKEQMPRCTLCGTLDGFPHEPGCGGGM